MKHLIALLPLLLLTLISSAQKREVTVTMADGTVRQLEYRLTRYQGTSILVNDNMKKFRGRENGEKVKLPEEEVRSIRLESGETYYRKRLKNNYVFGQYLAGGGIRVMKAFFWTTDFVSDDYMSMEITPMYFLETEEGLERIRPKRFIKDLRKECQELDEYLKATGRIRNRDIDVLLGRLNEMCQ